tara:strand:+ start:2533 stop:2649 length:117 start_codon:yes stop_codon:yes gene_type:complete
MKKLIDNIVEIVIKKRFSYIDLIVIAVIEFIILNLTNG